MIRVGIAEDQKLVREALCQVLGMDGGIQVIFSAENGEEAEKFLKEHSIDVLLLDIQMPKKDGVTLTKELKEKGNPVKILILTTFQDEDYIREALFYGAKGYLLKESGINEIQDAIQTVYQGQVYMDPKVANIYVNSMNQMQKKIPQKSSDILLSQRETEIVIAIAEGYSNKEIAKRYCLSEGTVKNHITHALTKLDLRDRTQLAVYAIREGLL